MKKRLLITSIVMMLVVAVALSTATYAWFTSNARVDMGTMTLKAATSDADAIGIGWLGGDSGTEISSNLYDVLKPMAPESLSVGTTTSAVTFSSATTREEDSVIVFNNDVVNDDYVLVSSLALSDKSAYYTLDGETRKAKAGVDYYTADGDLTPAEVTVDSTNVGAYYIRQCAPILYNNADVSAFYVKNLSTANPISRVDVYANFTASTVKVLTTDKTFKFGKTYFTADEVAQDAEQTYTSISVIKTGTPEANQRLAGAAIEGDYYQELDGNDLIRVAIFTKEAYKLGEGTPAANYTLLGVLGNAATEFVKETGSFDRNTTYYVATMAAASVTADNFVTDGTLFTEDDGVYTAVTEGSFSGVATYYEITGYNQTSLTATTFNTHKTNGVLYTANNTAVFGNSSSITASENKFNDGDVVKDLGHYTEVKESLTLDTNIQPEYQVDIVAIAWLDGTLLDDNNAGVMGQVSLYFKTV